VKKRCFPPVFSPFGLAVLWRDTVFSYFSRVTNPYDTVTHKPGVVLLFLSSSGNTPGGVSILSRPFSFLHRTSRSVMYDNEQWALEGLTSLYIAPLIITIHY